MLVRWRKYLENPFKMKGLSNDELKQQYIKAIRDYPCRFTGRAAGHIAGLVAKKTIHEISKSNCADAFLGSKGVHIDPYGNVFSGTCSGIIIGNISRNPLENIWKQFHPKQNELVDTLFNHGPAGLLDKFPNLGYQPAKVYANKCHLCTSVRKFLFDKGLGQTIIGPKEVYDEP